MKIEGHWDIGKAQNNNECPQRGKTGDPANFLSGGSAGNNYQIK